MLHISGVLHFQALLHWCSWWSGPCTTNKQGGPWQLSTRAEDLWTLEPERGAMGGRRNPVRGVGGCGG